MGVKTPVYLDYQATTPMDPQVLNAMTPWLGPRFGNPHSSTHRFGWEAEAAIDQARGTIASLINADPKAVFFTSGATESNNLAIKGVMEALIKQKPHMVIPVTEHKCVVESAKAMERFGARVTWLPVGENGLIDLDHLADSLSDETALVSVMAVHNEIGVVQPLAEIGALCRERGIYFHCDAAQAFGKLPLDVERMKIDILSISGHKIYGPKGVGAIYIRRSRPRVRFVPQMSGGEQENGVRAGTLAPALCVGLGEAARLASLDMGQEESRIRGLMQGFLAKIRASHPGILINGDLDARWWGNLNISFPGLSGDLLMSGVRDLAVSSGSACSSATTGPSYVLEAIGRPRSLASASLRFGIGRFTTAEEMDFAAETVCRVVSELGGLTQDAAE